LQADPGGQVEQSDRSGTRLVEPEGKRTVCPAVRGDWCESVPLRVYSNCTERPLSSTDNNGYTIETVCYEGVAGMVSNADPGWGNPAICPENGSKAPSISRVYLGPRGIASPLPGRRQARITSLTMISAATPSNTQPKTCLTARDFMRPAISLDPSWLPSSTAATLAIHTPHWGRAAVAR
jgi:hypothetical protein